MNENTEDLNYAFYNIEYFSIRRKLLVFFLIFLSSLIIFYFIAMIFLSRGYREAANAAYFNSAFAVDAQHEVYKKEKPLIIIDAGHGGEDGGASANNLTEKDINLIVSKKLGEFLSISGYPVQLTRTEDRMLYKAGEEGRKKYYDLRNRLEIAEGGGDCIFVSIHMNKFPLVSSKGLQVFYSVNNPLSKYLAQGIQTESKILDPENRRQIKPATSQIYILDQITKPAILIECGFLSNPAEALLLSDDEYQNKLAYIIFCGLTKSLSSAEDEGE